MSFLVVSGNYLCSSRHGFDWYINEFGIRIGIIWIIIEIAVFPDVLRFTLQRLALLVSRFIIGMDISRNKQQRIRDVVFLHYCVFAEEARIKNSWSKALSRCILSSEINWA